MVGYNVAPSRKLPPPPSRSTLPLDPFKDTPPAQRGRCHLSSAPKRPREKRHHQAQEMSNVEKSVERKHLFITAKSRNWLGSCTNALIFHMRSQIQKGHRTSQLVRGSSDRWQGPWPWRQKSCGPAGKSLTLSGRRSPTAMHQV